MFFFHLTKLFRNDACEKAPSKKLCLEVLEDRTLLSVSVPANYNIAQQSPGWAETTIAINPTDSNDMHLFAASNASKDPNISPPKTFFAAYSTNGGMNWTSSNLAGLPTGHYDEQATFDQSGHLFLTYLDDAGGDVLAWSTNGGQSFAGHAVVAATADQPSVATGDGYVWVSYNNGANSSGSIQASGASISALLSGGKVKFTTLTAPGSSGGGSYGDVKVGPNGEVMVTYQNPTSGQGPSTIYVNLDAGGLAKGAKFGNAVAVTSTNVGGYATIPAQPTNTIDAEANLAWDRDLSSAHYGRVYLVYTDRPSTTSADTDIYVRYSDNKGTTWSAPVRVNDNPLGDGTSQFLPAIAVDQSTGFVAVTWYDTRNSTVNNEQAQVYGTVSTDGDGIWAANVQIGAGLSNGVAAGGFNFGDYDTMDYANGHFYRSWADNSNPSLLSPANQYLPYVTPATARLDVSSTGVISWTAATGAASTLSNSSQPLQPQGTFTAAAPGPAAGTGRSGSVLSKGRDSESLDGLFAAAGEADQGVVWFVRNHAALDVGNLSGVDGAPTDGPAADEAFRALGGGT